jgi:hypothetical protein
LHDFGKVVAHNFNACSSQSPASPSRPRSRR